MISVRLKHHRAGQSDSCGRAIASPHADVILRGVVCLRVIAPALWGMTQHLGPGFSSLSSLPSRDFK